MKLGRLKAHLKAKHEEHINSSLDYFIGLKEDLKNRSTIMSIFNSKISTNCRIQEAGYYISLLIAKTGKDHTVGEKLIKPAISIFLNTVLGKGDKDLEAFPLSNNTVSRRIDEMSDDVEAQLILKLRANFFSIQMEESTLRDSKAVLLSYVRYIDNEEFTEELLFYKRLESSTTAIDIFNILKNYMDVNKIPMTNIISCAADGAPNMMGKRNGCLKLMKECNPEMIIVHCVIHKENLVAKKLSPVLNGILSAVIKCINYIKTSAKSERLFKLFCEKQNEDYVRLLLHTEVRWLSKGNCLRRFLELFDSVGAFLKDKQEMALLSSAEGKAYVSYLADIFEQLNSLNKQLQGSNRTLVDAKAKIFGFVTNLELCSKSLNNRNFEQFRWLKECEVSEEVLLEVTIHINMLITEFKERFSDLKKIDFPTWMMQPFLVDVADISNVQYQTEIAELQNDESVKTIFKLKGVNVWLYDETKKKYPATSEFARKTLLPFPSSYLAECGFSAINDLLVKKRNRLDITQCGDLRLKLTNIKPNIKSLCSKHQVHGSH